jgi:hypothetical protein
VWLRKVNGFVRVFTVFQYFSSIYPLKQLYFEGLFPFLWFITAPLDAGRTVTATLLPLHSAVSTPLVTYGMFRSVFLGTYFGKYFPREFRTLESSVPNKRLPSSVAT